jgi:methionyl aminopeptidase
MRFRQRQQIQVKTDEQLILMRKAGLVVARTLEELREAVRPGVSTQDLDEISAARIAAENAVPSFLGYHGYPATICASVNEEIVHGIPSPERVLRDGDIISIDCGAILNGWHGDAAISVGVGEIDPADQALLDACEAAMSARAAGTYGLVEEYTGHGIGTEMHMDPAVPNYGPPGQGPRLQAGFALAIEPMLTRGSRMNAELDDDWTVVTADGSRAAHFEHTVGITPEGPWVLTLLEGQEPEAARRAGVSVASRGSDAR